MDCGGDTEDVPPQVVDVEKAQDVDVYERFNESTVEEAITEEPQEETCKRRSTEIKKEINSCSMVQRGDG